MTFSHHIKIEGVFVARVLNKKTIVMGGTSGIGEAIVRKFADEGAVVAFCGRSIESGQRIESDCVNSKFIACDVRDIDSLKIFFASALKFLGGLDIAINNAGISGDIAAFHETTVNMLNEVMSTNFLGIWHAMQHEIKYLLDAGKGGAILNISSTSGLIGNALGLTPYSASKHAVVGLTKSTALEYAKFNIRINALCPGFVDTPMTERAGDVSRLLKRKIPMMHPIGRVATTEEIANAALYLCSDEASFTTGSCMIVDGGLTT
jgi:NAD(P)-dependent dehydrogenase (short-subunit alcohol dehydrogenase family)